MPLFSILRDLVDRFPSPRPYFDRLISETTPPWFEAQEHVIGMTMLRRNDKEWTQQDLKRRRREEGVYAPALPRTLIAGAAAGLPRGNRSRERMRPLQERPTLEYEARPLSYEGERGRGALPERKRNRHHQRTSYDHTKERSNAVVEGRMLHQDLQNMPEKRIRKQQLQEEREWVNFDEAGGRAHERLEQLEREQSRRDQKEAENRDKEHFEGEAIRRQKQESLRKERLGKDEQQRKQEHKPAQRAQQEEDPQQKHHCARRKDQHQEQARRPSHVRRETKQENILTRPSATIPAKDVISAKEQIPTSRPPIPERKKHNHRQGSTLAPDADRRLDHKHIHHHHHHHHHRSASPAPDIRRGNKAPAAT